MLQCKFQNTMEAKFLSQSMSGWLPEARWRHKCEFTRMSRVVAVLARPIGKTARVSLTGDRALLTVPAEATQVKTNGYDDNWFDRIAINHLSQSVQAASGLRNMKNGYESLVEAATQVYRKSNSIQQYELVIRALEKAFPKPILSLIRTMLPNSKLKRGFFAVFTTLFFAWLVGPCELKESKLNGSREKNVVLIKKCRFLEQGNCVGMCVNMCKLPSQTFMKDHLGISVNMVPNFDDMSCEMIFGQDPPAPNNDPALSQPCYKLCKSKRKHAVNCST